MSELSITPAPRTLSALIRETAATSGMSDPRDIAALVAAATPEHELRDFYARSLVGEVRVHLSADRNTAIRNVFTPPARSAKLAQRRDWWTEMLSSRVHVAGTWKTLGECGKQDLAAAAAERRADADRVMAQADTYDTLRDLLTRFKVKTVAQLPAHAVPTTLGDAA